MKQFMDADFLLSTECARRLFHDYAEPMPILDYHCHLDPKDIAEDKQFENITQIWLRGDHYKWRQMRSNGVEEYYITGDAPDREKFQKWAETLEMAVGNPLYHWSHLELQKYFGYQGYLNRETAEEVWNLCNQSLKKKSMSVRNLLRQSKVTLLCTTDDPADSLKWHKKIAEDDSFEIQVLPTFRPDRAMHLEKEDYTDYLQELGKAGGIEIVSFRTLLEALRQRIGFFASMGCRIADHGLEYVMYRPASEEAVEAVFQKRLSGNRITKEERLQFQTAFLLAVAREYHARDWAMQLHYGCRRDNNRTAYEALGPDTGFDCIYGGLSSLELPEFLNALKEEEKLPKTILYSLNPGDNALIGTVLGCFQDASAIGKIQHGSAWWFNDHKEGMTEQLISLANLGLLGNFIGMLTDSRSFLSYTRHTYFRRILCELIGGWVENGEYPRDEAALRRIIEGISYNNAVRYFGFRLSDVSHPEK